MPKRDEGNTATNAKLDKTTEATASRIVTILLIGQTGAGKSQFIRVAAGIPPDDSRPPRIGHTVISETDTVEAFLVTNPDDPTRYVRLIDTPGFNDSDGAGDDEHLRKIVRWLKEEPHTMIDGVLYLHEIIQLRSIHNDIVKPKDIPRPPGIFVVTTKWSSTSKRRAEENVREQNLRTELGLSAESMRRFDNTSQSAWKIIAAVEKSPAKVTRNKLAEELEVLCPHFRVKQQDRSLIKRLAKFFRRMF